MVFAQLPLLMALASPAAIDNLGQANPFECPPAWELSVRMMLVKKGMDREAVKKRLRLGLPMLVWWTRNYRNEIYVGPDYELSLGFVGDVLTGVEFFASWDRW